MNIGSNIATNRDERPHVTFKEIRQQVWNDLATKEVQTSPTYSYQWMADQVGHMAIGMAVVLLFWPFGGIWPVIGFIVVVIGASLLELWDYRQACRKIRLPFNATRDRKDLRQNASIAVYYMALGGLFALLALMLDKLPTSLPVIVRVVIMFIVFVIAIIGPAFYWLRQKILFQQIGLPFLFRLPEFKLHRVNFKQPVGPEAAKWMETAKWIDDGFINGDGEGKHIAIVGSLNSGKTSLAVAIATEGSFNGKKARYLTFNKLQQIGLKHEPPPPRNTKLWRWKSSELLIIDDVPAGAAESQKQLLQALQELGPDVRKELKKKNTVWCLGADVSDVELWIDTLKRGCGLDPKKLLTVTLENPEGKKVSEGKKGPEKKKDYEGSIGRIHGEVPSVHA